MAIDVAVEDVNYAARTFEGYVKNFTLKGGLKTTNHYDIWIVAYFVRPIDCWYHRGRHNLARGEKSHLVQG